MDYAGKKDRLVVAYPPKPITDKIKSYVNRHPGMSISSFMTDAAKEVLRRAGELPPTQGKKF